MATKRKKTTALDVARDVKALLRAKKIKANPGCYLNMGSANEERFAGQSLQKAIRSQGFRNCEVCGIGAMFMAYVDRENKVDIPHDIEDSTFGDFEMIEKTLRGVINGRQLDLIETAFEQGNATSNMYGDDGGLAEQVATLWGEQYKDDKERLIAICDNMIENKGKFRPTVSAKYE